MAAKTLITALTLTGINTLTAQAPATALRHAGVDDSSLGDIVSQLGQNALQVLLIVVAIMGLAWLFYICNTCIGLNKKQKSSGMSSCSFGAYWLPDYL